jgi:effector-binding domain-containing protein
MTAPVVQKRTPSTKMSMTAPVTQTARDDQFAVQFMMPSKYARDELPVPNDDRVQIREVPARRLAAIRYSGTWSKKRYDTYWEKLAHVLAANGYTPVGEPIWARYDPPFKPWFLRRNEILTAFR